MLHHVTLDVPPAEIEMAIGFWTLLGFIEVTPPPDLAATFTWLEREGTQIHLMRAESPKTPHGHAAVIVPDFERTLARLDEQGFEVSPKRKRWGSPRAETIAPGGHRVELMATPPSRA